MSTQEVVDTIVRIVSPYLGETMTRASARAHCEKLGIAGDDATPGQVEALIGRFGAGLNIFIGREKTSQVVRELKKAVSLEGRERAS
jgi:hypothetical protein